MSSKIKSIRKAKYYFYKYGIHRLLPKYKLNFLGHLSGLSKWISEHRDLDYSTFPSKEFSYNNRIGLHQYIIDHVIKDVPIDYLEFGVSKGRSFKWWIKNSIHPESFFYGFDTFTGLPEDWGHFKKGDMSNGNEPPQIDDPRHQFFQGIFQSTLHPFLKNYRSEKLKVIHMDADIYSATLFVLSSISPFLNKGDIILFDEFNVPLHEFKAFSDWVNSYYIEYKAIGETNNYYQVAIRIL